MGTVFPHNPMFLFANSSGKEASRAIEANVFVSFTFILRIYYCVVQFTSSLEKLFFQHSRLCVFGAKITASEVFSGGNLRASGDNVIVQPSRKLPFQP